MPKLRTNAALTSVNLASVNLVHMATVSLILLAASACSNSGAPLFSGSDGQPVPPSSSAESGIMDNMTPLFGESRPQSSRSSVQSASAGRVSSQTASIPNYSRSTAAPLRRTSARGNSPIGMPVLGTSVPLNSGAVSNNTHVGLRISALQQDLQRLRDAMALHKTRFSEIRTRASVNAEAYQQNVAPIYARLQIGTTPGNPILTQQWREAELRLNVVNGDIDSLNNLGNDVASDAALSAYLLDSTRATYGLSGAYEEDHRQLSLLEDEVNRTVIGVDRLLNEISSDISRQGNYVAAERANLTALALAVKTGSFFDAPPSGGNNAAARNSVLSPASFTPRSRNVRLGHLMMIRFDSPNMRFEPQIEAPIRETLARNPDTRFRIVGTAPVGGNAAPVQKAMERVFKAMTKIGVRAENVELSSDTGGIGRNVEVRIFVN